MKETNSVTRIVELIIEENNQELAIDAISLVSAPAIEQDFVFFGKEKHNLTFAKVDEEKRMLVSPALIPNKQIFRYDPNTDSEYYVYFSKDTVRKASELYLKHNNHHKATYEHSDRVSGVLTVESWVKEGDQDKSKLYGYDLPNGTWFVKMRIDNDDLWQEIKSGTLRGLSIEGYFVDKMQKMSETQPTDHEILTALNEIIQESNKPKKVELSSIKELQKQITGMKQGMKWITGKLDEGKRYVKELNKYRNFSLSIFSDLKKVEPKMHIAAQEKLDKFEKAAKDLGVDIGSVSEVKEIKKLIEETEQKIKDTEKLFQQFRQAGLKD